MSQLGHMSLYDVIANVKINGKVEKIKVRVPIPDQTSLFYHYLNIVPEYVISQSHPSAHFIGVWQYDRVMK